MDVVWKLSFIRLNDVVRRRSESTYTHTHSLDPYQINDLPVFSPLYFSFS